METKLAQFSVVVVGKVHNPTILNPDFLAVREIVPKQWGWEVVDGSFTTPPLAMVRYKQGISVIVEHEKLQVVDASGTDPTESRAAEIAKRYVKTLPHVRYTAVGNNFRGIVRVDDPSAYLKDRFLKCAECDTADRPLEAFGLRFVYPLSNGRIVLSIDTGETTVKEVENEAKYDVIVVSANFHRDCANYPADEEVVRHIGQSASDWPTYKTLLHDVLRIEWQAQ